MKQLACVMWVLAASLPGSSHADEGSDRPFKLTLGEYRYNQGGSGHDLNLRWRHNDSNFWVGAYRDPDFGSQLRIGADTSVALGGSASLQPSVQLASGGFVGASVNFQVGDPWFALVGLGRTNLKPYFNLNFDPNDAITGAIGWHGDNGRTVSLVLVADNRLHTGQKDWHVYTRWPLSNDLRASFDLLRKTGEGDSGYVRAWGWSTTLDFPSWFVRLARDPKQNFSAQDATRLAVGVRF